MSYFLRLILFINNYNSIQQLLILTIAFMRQKWILCSSCFIKDYYRLSKVKGMKLDIFFHHIEASYYHFLFNDDVHIELFISELFFEVQLQMSVPEYNSILQLHVTNISKKSILKTVFYIERNYSVPSQSRVSQEGWQRLVVNASQVVR